MPVTVTYQSKATVAEVLSNNVPFASVKTVTQSGMDTTATLKADSTPPATTCALFQKALSSGAATIDLTSLTGTNGAAVDFTGLKVQIAKFANPATNANPITVTFGASNGYLLGGTAWKAILSPGDEITFFKNDTGPDVDSTHKTIDLAGTGSQALNVELIAG